MPFRTIQRLTIILASLALGGTPASAGPTEDALRVGEEAFAKKEYANDETCAKLLMNAASLMAQSGRSKESAVCYENLLKLRQKLSGADSIEAQKVKSLLAAQISNSGGDIDRAEQLVRESSEALAKAGDEHLDDQLLALTNLAGILFMKKDRLGAHDIYAQVVALCDRHPGKSPGLAVEAYKAMAAIAEFFGRPKENLQFLRKAAEVSRKHLGAESPATYLARIDVASALSAVGMNADAKQAFDEIISDLEKKAPSPEDKLMHQRWAAAAYRLAYTEAALGNRDRVFELLKSALSHAQAGWGDLDANALPIYLDLAKIYITRKNYQEGVKCYQKVLDIRRRELGPDHESTKETQKILIELLDDVQKAKTGKK
jgi:tetratricopeptide (TPR) repeat protein